MSENFRQKYKLISSLVMCVLSLFSCVTLTFSWFSFNRETSGGGADVEIVKIADYLGCEYYYVDKDITDGFVFKKATLPSQKNLGEFDILNEKYQLILKLCFKTTVKNVHITAGTTTDYFLGNPDFPLLSSVADSSGVLTPLSGTSVSGKTYTNALSSVVSFNVLSYGTGGIINQTDDSGALTGNYYASDLPQSGYVKFMQSTSETALPENKIVISQTAQPVTDSFNGQTCGAIYLMLSYDKTLMSTVFSTNIGNEALNAADGEQVSIAFKRDFYIGLEADE